MHIIDFADVSNHFVDTVRWVADHLEPVRIKINNAPDIVMLNAKKYEELVETIYLFSDPTNAAYINESIKQAERGEFVEVDY